MLCPNCHRENRPSSRFCIYCGTPLTDAEATSPDASPQDAREEIQRLRALLTEVSNRLNVLESRQGAVEIPPSPEPSIPEEEPAAVEPEVEPVPIPEPVIAPTIKKPPRKEREWEQILGGSWLARIGVLALIIGIGFFLKYAFDNNWLGPTGRVIFGIVAGLVMLGGGYRWRKRYPIMNQVLSGGGIAVLYLSIFASFGLYDLVNFYVALAFLFVVSVASAVLALRYNSMSLAIIGIIGAFLAPFILGAFREGGAGTSDSGQAVQLLAYIIVVDLGVLVLATFRNWRWFTLLALFCSLICFGVWYGEFEREISTVTAEVGITAIFIVFFGATTLFHIVWRRITPRATDFGLMTLNAAAYFGISIGLMWDDYREWLGLHVFLMAVLYGLLAYLAYRRKTESPLLGLFVLGISIIFLTVAIPLQLGDKAWATIAWSAEGAVLIWLSYKSRIITFRYTGYLVFAAMAIRLMAFDTTVEMAKFQPIINERFLAFIVGIATMYVSAYFMLRERKGRKHTMADITVFLLVANFLTIWIFSFEVWDYFGHSLATADFSAKEGLSDAQNLALTGVWAVYAVVLLGVGIWRRWRYVRLGALALLVVPIVKVFVYDVFKLELGYRIGAFVGLGVLLLTAAYLYQRYSTAIKGVFTEK